MKKLFIETYGCQMNVADSEVVASVMQMAGYEICEKEEEADAIFLNTCSIRENAENKIYHRLDTLHAEQKKGRKVILGVLGCMAERVKDDLIQNHYANLVCGPDSYLNLPDMIAQCEMGTNAINIELSKTETYRDIVPQRIGGNRVSGFVSIMRGCNNFCHYCIVPYTRGRERSRDAESILREVRDLHDRGFKEVTLLGQNVNSYGKGLEEKVDFSDLLNLLCTVPGDYHIRFMTSHPKDASHKLIDTIAAQPKLCRHLHLPVQCGSDRMLAQMNRHYTVAQYLELIEYARRTVPGITFSSDIIVGFPGETEEDFVKTLELVRKVGYMQLFTFIYSKRTGTKAAEMPDPTPRKEKTDRMSRLLKIQDEIAMDLVKAQVGQTVRVICDGIDDESGLYLCRTAADAPEVDGNVCVSSEEPLYPGALDRKSTRLNSSHSRASRMPSSA